MSLQSIDIDAELPDYHVPESEEIPEYISFNSTTLYHVDSDGVPVPFAPPRDKTNRMSSLFNPNPLNGRIYGTLHSLDLGPLLRAEYSVQEIRIHNFKSYFSTHVVPLWYDNDTKCNMISVIGCNGCGKSNLLDAIFFVLNNDHTGRKFTSLSDLINEGAKTFTMIDGEIKYQCPLNPDKDDIQERNKNSSENIRCSVSLQVRQKWFWDCGDKDGGSSDKDSRSTDIAFPLTSHDGQHKLPPEHISTFERRIVMHRHSNHGSVETEGSKTGSRKSLKPVLQSALFFCGRKVSSEEYSDRLREHHLNPDSHEFIVLQGSLASSDSIISAIDHSSLQIVPLGKIPIRKKRVKKTELLNRHNNNKGLVDLLERVSGSSRYQSMYEDLVIKKESLLSKQRTLLNTKRFQEAKLRSLESQCVAGEKKRCILQRIQEIEYHKWIIELDELNCCIDWRGNAKVLESERIKDLENIFSRTKYEIQDIKNSILKKESDIGRLNKLISEARKKVEAVEMESISYQCKFQQSRDMYDRTKKRINDLEMEISTIEVKINRLDEKKTGILDSIESMKIAKTLLVFHVPSSSLQISPQLITEYHENNRLMSDSLLVGLKSERLQIEKNILILKEEMDQKRGTLSVLTKLYEDREKEYRDSKDRYTLLRINLKSLDTRRSQTLEMLYELRKKKEDIEKSMNPLVDERSKIMDQVTFCRHQNKKNERCIRIHEIVNNLKASFSGVVGTFSSVMKVRESGEKYQKAVFTALGKQRDSIITITRDDALSGIKFLKENRFEAMEFIPLEKYLNGTGIHNNKNGFGVYNKSDAMVDRRNGNSVRTRPDARSHVSGCIICTNIVGVKDDLLSTDIGTAIASLIEDVLSGVLIFDTMTKARESFFVMKNRVKTVTLDCEMILPSGNMVAMCNEFFTPLTDLDLRDRLRSINSGIKELEDVYKKITRPFVSEDVKHYDKELCTIDFMYKQKFTNNVRNDEHAYDSDIFSKDYPIQSIGSGEYFLGKLTQLIEILEPEIRIQEEISIRTENSQSNDIELIELTRSIESLVEETRKSDSRVVSLSDEIESYTAKMLSGSSELFNSFTDNEMILLIKNMPKAIEWFNQSSSNAQHLECETAQIEGELMSLKNRRAHIHQKLSCLQKTLGNIFEHNDGSNTVSGETGGKFKTLIESINTDISSHFRQIKETKLIIDKLRGEGERYNASLRENTEELTASSSRLNVLMNSISVLEKRRYEMITNYHVTLCHLVDTRVIESPFCDVRLLANISDYLNSKSMTHNSESFGDFKFNLNMSILTKFQSIYSNGCGSTEQSSPHESAHNIVIHNSNSDTNSDTEHFEKGVAYAILPSVRNEICLYRKFVHDKDYGPVIIAQGSDLIENQNEYTQRLDHRFLYDYMNKELRVLESTDIPDISIANLDDAKRQYVDLKSQLSLVNTQCDDIKNCISKVNKIYSIVKERRMSLFMVCYEYMKKHLKEVYSNVTRDVIEERRCRSSRTNEDALISYNPREEVRIELERLDQPYLGGIHFEAPSGGHKLMDVNRFSGGERTLALCAFLFTVFRFSRPALVAIDEVDAPLDNFNVPKISSFIYRESLKIGFPLVVITQKIELATEGSVLIGVSSLSRQLRSVDGSNTNGLFSRIFTLDLRWYEESEERNDHLVTKNVVDLIDQENSTIL